jgi:hypothetical protein
VGRLSAETAVRNAAVDELHAAGDRQGRGALARIESVPALRALLVSRRNPVDAVGVAVDAKEYEQIFAVWDVQREHEVPADRLVSEFHIDRGEKRLDVIRAVTPEEDARAAESPISKFLQDPAVVLAGKRVHHVEFAVTDVAALTETLAALGRPDVKLLFPAPIEEADGKLSNYARVATADGDVLVEFAQERSLPSASAAAGAAVQGVADRLAAPLATGNAVSSADLGLVASRIGFAHGETTLAEFLRENPGAVDGQAVGRLRDAILKRFHDRRSLAAVLAELQPAAQLQTNGGKFAPVEIRLDDTTGPSSAAEWFDLISLLAGVAAPDRNGDGRAGRSAEVAALLETARAAAALNPESHIDLKDVADAYGRGAALRKFLDERRNTARELFRSYPDLLSDSGAKPSSDSVLTVDLFAPSIDAVDYDAAAELIAAQGADTHVLLVLDVPGADSAQLERRLAQALEGKQSADRLERLRSRWEVLSRSGFREAGIVSGRGAIDSRALHEWLHDRKGKEWQLSAKFLLAIATADERRWEISRQDYIRIFKLLLPGIAVHVTHELEDYLKANKVLEIQA